MKVSDYQVRLLLSGLLDAFGVERLRGDQKLVKELATGLQISTQDAARVMQVAVEYGALIKPKIKQSRGEYEFDA